MLSISVVATIVVALPVLLSPHERIFGGEIVGRHHDPLTVIQQFAQGGVQGLYRQPLTDDVGARLSRVFGPVAAYNVVVLATFPLAALGAYALARYLRLPHRGSLVAGLIFAFAPVHVAQAAYHPHIAQVQWIPIYFLTLFVAVDRPTLTSAALLAATAGCLTLSNFYGGLIGAAVTPVALAAYWTAAPRGPRTARGLILPLTTLVGLLGLGLVAVRAVAPDVFRNPEALAFPLSDLDRFGARWWAYFVPPVDNALARSDRRGRLAARGHRSRSARAADLTRLGRTRSDGRPAVGGCHTRVRSDIPKNRRRAGCHRALGYAALTRAGIVRVSQSLCPSSSGAADVPIVCAFRDRDEPDGRDRHGHGRRIPVETSRQGRRSKTSRPAGMGRRPPRVDDHRVLAAAMADTRCAPDTGPPLADRSRDDSACPRLPRSEPGGFGRPVADAEQTRLHDAPLRRVR